VTCPSRRPGRRGHAAASLAISITIPSLASLFLRSLFLDAHVKTTCKPENDKVKAYYQGFILADLNKAGFFTSASILAYTRSSNMSANYIIYKFILNYF
jgi:hypothetical protein